MNQTSGWKVAACIAIPLFTVGIVYAILDSADNGPEPLPQKTGTNTSEATNSTPARALAVKSPSGKTRKRPDRRRPQRPKVPSEPKVVYNTDWEKIGPLNKFVISRDRRLLLTYQRDSKGRVGDKNRDKLIVWDLKTHKELRRLQQPEGVFDWIISPDNVLAIARMAQLEYRCWALRSGRVVRHYQAGRALYSKGLQISSNGKWIAIPGRGTFRLLALATGKMRTLPFGRDTVYLSVALHPHKPVMVVSRSVRKKPGAKRKAELLVYAMGPTPIQGGKVVKKMIAPNDAILRLKFSADGNSLMAYSNGSNGGFVVFDTRTWRKRAFIAEATRLLSDVTDISADGKYLVFVRAESGRPRAQVVDVAKGTIKPLGGEWCKAAQFVDSEIVALATYKLPLRFYNVRTGQIVDPPKPRTLSEQPFPDPIAKLPPERRLPAYRKQGKFIEAITVGEPLIKASAKKLEAGDPATLKLARALADAYRGRGAHRQAIELYRKLITVSEPRIANKDIAFPPDTGNLVRTLVQFGKLKEAMTVLRESLAERQKRFGADHLAVADARMALGYWLHQFDNAVEAAAQFDKALAIREKSKGYPRPVLAITMLHAGQAHVDSDAFDRGMPLLREGAAVLLETFPVPKSGPLRSEHGFVAEAVLRLALAYRASGRNTLYTRYRSHAHAIFERLPPVDTPAMLHFMLQYSSILAEWGQANGSEAMTRRAVQMGRRLYGMGDLIIARFRLTMARSHLKAGLTKLTRRYFDSGMEGYRKIFGDDYPGRAELTFLRGRIHTVNRDRDGGLKLVQLSRKIAGDNTAADRRVKIEASLFLADTALKKKKFAEALIDLEQAVRALRGGLQRVLPILPDSVKPDYSQRLVRYLDEPLSGIADIHRAADRYGNVDKQILRDAAERSAEWIINTKGLANEMLAGRSVLIRGNIAPAAKAVLEKLHKVRSQLAGLSAGNLLQGTVGTRTDRINELFAIEAKLSAEAGRLLAGKTLFRDWVSLADVRKRIAADSVVVEFARYRHVDPLMYRHRALKLQYPKGYQRGGGMKVQPAPFGDFYAAWVIPPAGKGDVKFVPLGPASALDLAVKRLRLQNASGADNNAVVSRSLHRAVDRLSTLLMAKLEPALEPYKRWIVSPDSALWMVPFACLRSSRDKYIIETREIACVTSARELLADSTKGKSKVAAIFANPDYNLGVAKPNEQAGLAPLPETANEAKAVTPSLEKYVGAKPQVFLQAAATEKQVKSIARPRVLLLSTHGYFLPVKTLKNPLLRAGVVFAGVNRMFAPKPKGAKAKKRKPDQNLEDGLLTALEVTAMDLTGTELVVLSACDTGRGDVYRAEGVAGLRQAFHLAGARSVVATLWSVPDTATSELVTEFFNQLAAGKRKTEALRLAQLKVMRSRGNDDNPGHPYLWSAFMISGVTQ